MNIISYIMNHIFFFVGADPNCKDYDCRTPLHSAIVKGSRSYDCVRLLLDGGADVNHKDRYLIIALSLIDRVIIQ